MKDSLLNKIKNREAVIGVVGLGYVGLPLLIEFGKAGFPVLGLDIDDKKTEALKSGTSYIKHIDSEEVKDLFVDKKADDPMVDASTNFARTSECDAILICVPTPLTKHRDPDLSYIIDTADKIGKHLCHNQIVILESTTYPGTTEEVLVPLLEELSEMKAGDDFYVAYSPEREDPNNKDFGTKKIPKVVGAINDDALEAACALYDCVICETVKVSNCRTAEATKLTENIFRCINIALVNELKMVYSEMDIDIWEVVKAASSKPFGFMPFYPGPGLGGHCIPIDPFYLTWKAKEYGMQTKFIELAGEINMSMPNYVIQNSLLALNSQNKSIKDSKVLLVGLAYKKNVDDDRESPTYEIWERMENLGAKVDYYDPFCPVVQPTREHPQFAGIKSATLDDIKNGGYDLAIISTAHDCVDHDDLAKMLPLTVDTRGICKPADNVVKS